ncbi:DUF4382 domain-containing protein [Caenimonas sp. SL110]|uniref:DUF4382 domain-containing protein n=1 Tax=Caenimonas sp. SL110 TaxID=1450524 RepID=UPI0006542344|nr:DUF4382 domain-containing protein [Caenimonas sp. SL110]
MEFENTKVRWVRGLQWSAAAVAAAVLAACGGGGGGGSSAAADGTLRVALTDAPSCGYDHVWVTVEKVRVHQSSSAADADTGWAEITLATPRRVDLLALTNGALEELGSTQLAAGSYSQIRLVLSANSGTNATANAVQPTGGAVTALTTPSGQQSGLKLQANFVVASGQTADLVLDFDACKSVVKAGNSGQYILKPVMTVLPRVTSSTIQGAVATTLPLAKTTVAAQQNGVTVRSTTPDATGNFALPYLPIGTYTLVITSDAHATGVVTGVPSGSTPTVVSTPTTAITLPTSTMADIGGVVTSGTAIPPVLVTDATARALQALTGGPTIEVASKPVDGLLASYQFRVPVAAPVKAAYAAGSALTWTADTAGAGKYTIQIQAPGRATQDKPADVSASSAVTVNFGY